MGNENLRPVPEFKEREAQIKTLLDNIGKRWQELLSMDYSKAFQEARNSLARRNKQIATIKRWNDARHAKALATLEMDKQDLTDFMDACNGIFKAKYNLDKLEKKVPGVNVTEQIDEIDKIISGIERRNSERFKVAIKELENLRGKFEHFKTADSSSESKELFKDIRIVRRTEWKALAMRNIEQQTEYKEPFNDVFKNIVIHHAAGTFGSPRSMQDYQMNKMKFDDLGYHFYISREGKIYEGRELKYMGSHAGQSKEANEEAKKIRDNISLKPQKKPELINEVRKKDPDYGSIGIVIDGNYQIDKLTDAQKKALEQLLTTLKGNYDIPLRNIMTHKDVRDHIIEAQDLNFEGKDTLCPGGHVLESFDEIKNSLPPDSQNASAKYNAPKEKLAFTEELKEAWKDHSIGEFLDLGWSFYDRKKNLKNPQDPLFSNNLESIFKGDSDFLEQPLGEPIEVDFKNAYEGKIYYPKVVNLTSSKAFFGYRNRKEYRGDIKNTAGLIIPLAHPLLPTDQLKQMAGVQENTTVIGLRLDNEKIVTGGLKEFMNEKNVVLSRTTRNDVKDIPMDKNANVLGKPPRNKNAQYGYQHIKIVTKEGVHGSLPILFKGLDGQNRMGNCMGGSLIFESQDRKRLIFVSGTANQIAKAFKLFKGNDEYATIYNLDNGTYALGFQTKNQTLKEKDLRKYDLENTSGGHGLYLKIDTRMR